MQPHQQPGYRPVPLRRIVIFVHKSRKIILVPSRSYKEQVRSFSDSIYTVDRNWHEDNKRQGIEPAEFLQLIPRNPARDPSFVATALLPLRPDNPGSFAGIPLCSATLRSIESQNRFECVSIGLTFRTEESRKKFSETSRVMWKEWYMQTKTAERQPGYSPLARRVQPALPAPLTLQSQPKPPSKTRSWIPLRTGTASSNIDSSNGSISKEDTTLHSPHRGGGRGGSRKSLKNGETIP
jgi:hypothetical protein